MIKNRGSHYTLAELPVGSRGGCRGRVEDRGECLHPPPRIGMVRCRTHTPLPLAPTPDCTPGPDSLQPATSPGLRHRATVAACRLSPVPRDECSPSCGQRKRGSVLPADPLPDVADPPCDRTGGELDRLRERAGVDIAPKRGWADVQHGAPFRVLPVPHQVTGAYQAAVWPGVEVRGRAACSAFAGYRDGCECCGCL